MGSRVTVGGAKTAAGRGGTPYTTNSEKGQRGQRPERSEMPFKRQCGGPQDECLARKCQHFR